MFDLTYNILDTILDWHTLVLLIHNYQRVRFSLVIRILSPSQSCETNKKVVSIKTTVDVFKT